MTIYDGRASFYQWDLNQKITSNTFAVGDKIHFFNMRQTNALVVKAYELDGKVVADVPNILLQNAIALTVWRYEYGENSAQTIEEHIFKVEQRAQPYDYFYTETELYELRKEVEKSIGELDDIKTSLELAEQSRVMCEDERVADENNRIIAEASRVDAEKTRESDESIRKTNETARKSAETKRANAEQSRVNAEQDRVFAEQERVVAENLRRANFEQLPNNIGNALKGIASGEVVRMDDVSPIEHSVRVKISGKNLFNTNAIDVANDNDGDLYVSDVGEGTITITSSENYVGNGFLGINRTLRELCPQVIAGKEYVLTATSPSNVKAIFLVGKSVVWPFGTSKILTEDLINCNVVFYGYDSTIYGHGDCVISNIQIEEGAIATEYTPHIDPTTSIVTKYANNLFDESLLPYEKTTIKGIECYDLAMGVTSDYIYINSGKRPVALSYFAQSDGDSATIEIIDYNGAIHYQASYSIGGFGLRKNTFQNGIKCLRFLNWCQAYAYGFMINVGDTPMNYEPYNGTTYIPSVDGTINISSLSPTMTLLTDTAGVTIEAKYNKDANLVINDLQSQLIELRTIINELRG